MSLNTDMHNWYKGDRNLRRVEVTGLDQGAGDTIISDDVHWEDTTTVYSVSAANSTSGTIRFSVMVNEESGWEDLVDPETTNQQEIDLAAPQSFQIYQQNIIGLRVEPDTVVGTYDILVRQQIV